MPDVLFATSVREWPDKQFKGDEMRSTQSLSRMLVSLIVLVGLCVLAPSLSANAAERSSSHGKRHEVAEMSRFLSAAKGGTVRLGRASIYVPPNVMLKRSKVSVTKLSHGRYDMHIAGPWSGSVGVTLPRHSKNAVLMHRIRGTWLPEGRPGQRKVVVTHLSVFSWITDKAKAAVCFVSFSKYKFLQCLAGKLGKTISGQVADWIAQKLGTNCYATLVLEGVLGGPSSVAIGAFTDPACVGNAGETYHVPVVPPKPAPPKAAPPAPKPVPPGTPAPTVVPGAHQETAGGRANTWTDPASAGGTNGASIPAGATVSVSCRVTGFKVANGNTWWYRIASSPWNNAFYATADAFYNNGSRSGSLQGTPFVDTSVPLCAGSAPPPPETRPETVGGNANTWTNYTNAGGTQGPTIPNGTTVAISCKVTGFKVADGNTWWYRIASSPWNNAYYVSADAFYNNGATSGSLRGTPFVDPAVPTCTGPGSDPTPPPPPPPPPPVTYSETVGGNANTWTNYTNAGGAQGPTIPKGTTVQIACKLTGFRVADGNTWWYRIASSPWNGAYYVSADAFYNNGATSGSLIGTPFVDPAVPNC